MPSGLRARGIMTDVVKGSDTEINARPGVSHYMAPQIICPQEIELDQPEFTEASARYACLTQLTGVADTAALLLGSHGK